MPIAPDASASLSEPAETVLAAWDARLRVLTNPTAWQGVGLSLGVGALGLGVLMTFISRSAAGLYLAAGLFAALMLVFVLVALVIDAFGGFRVRFLLTSLGVRSQSGKSAKAAANAAFVGGVLTGNAAAAGSGLLARSEQDVFIAYGDVKQVRVNRRRRYVVVRGDWLQKPIGLACDEGNFARVLEVLKERCPAARFTQ
jgi:hypothetical protein